MGASLENYGGEVPRFILDEGNKLENKVKDIEKTLEFLKAELKTKEYEYAHSDNKMEELVNLTQVSGFKIK